ncbi:MAG: ABC transporter permease [Caloramator sp.]|nr:ABC transporter permease [Caloramator sp.]
MIVLNIAYNKFIRNWRDKTNLILLFIFPIIIIYILGTSLSSTFSNEEVKIKADVAVINKDKGEFSKGFENYLKNERIKEFLNVSKFEAMDEAEKKLKKGEITAIIHINEDYSEKIKRGEKASINVIENPIKNYRGNIIRAIVESYINGLNTMEAVLSLNKGDLQYQFIKATEGISLTKDLKVPRAIDYYAVTMLIMTIMYGTIIGCNSIGEGYFSRTIQRLKVAGIKNNQIFFGTLLGDFLWLFADSLIMLLITKFVYGVNWGNNYPLIILILILTCILSLSIGILVYMLVGNQRIGDAILQILVAYFTFISGGYVKLEVEGTLIEKLQYTSPSFLSQRAIFNTIYGGSFNETVQYISILSLLVLIMFAVSSLLGRRRVN